MWSHDKLLHIHIWFHMTNLQCLLFFRDLRCFDANSILSRFTHFCVEQKFTQICCLWSKNDKYYGKKLKYIKLEV